MLGVSAKLQWVALDPTGVIVDLPEIPDSPGKGWTLKLEGAL